MLDVTAKDSKGFQVFGETKTFNMIGYTEKHQKGEMTVDSWLVSSWEDKALQPGKMTLSFEITAPAEVTDVEVQVVLKYHLADKVWPMTQASQKIPVRQRRN
ncbi:hypothetical protein L0156_08285 [bacterium]|nr:hypothetical protein [bacterium]